MNKKARPKHKRKEKSGTKPRGGNSAKGVLGRGSDFVRRSAELEDLFACFNAEDVCLALGVSDLWLPNISSQVKHCHAFGVFASMAPSRFSSKTRINTYALFHDFVVRTYALLPEFPMLEDYVPEADWGDVRIQSRGQFLKMFYGNAVERIPDFVEAFRLRVGTMFNALADMHIALVLQDHVIEAVDPSSIGSAEDVRAGHTEVPAERFWQSCSAALASASEAPPNDMLAHLIHRGAPNLAFDNMI